MFEMRRNTERRRRVEGKHRGAEELKGGMDGGWEL